MWGTDDDGGDEENVRQTAATTPKRGEKLTDRKIQMRTPFARSAAERRRRRFHGFHSRLSVIVVSYCDCDSGSMSEIVMGLVVVEIPQGLPLYSKNSICNRFVTQVC